MITFTFNSVAERKPEHGQEIIYLKSRSSFGSEGFEPRETVVEYCWFGVDEDGYHDGNQIIYDPDGESPEGCVLEILFDDYIAQPNDHWCAVDDYWSAIDGGLNKDDLEPPK